MCLRFRRSRADGRPANQVGDVLRHDGVEKFRRRRQAHLRDLQQKLARFLDAGLDVVTAVEVRIVDKTFPAYRRARLLKIDPHDEFKLLREFFPQRIQLLRVFKRAADIMDRTRPDDDEQSRVFLLENVRNPLATVKDGLVRGISRRQLRLQRRRRGEANTFANA